MQTLKYKVIASKNQYKDYCALLERLVCAKQKDKNVKDEIALLTILIEKWEADHIISSGMDPVQLLRSLMKDHHLKSQDLVDILGISKGYVSDILNYKKAFSKQVIRNLASYFKVSQEAFNRPYALVTNTKQGLIKQASIKRTRSRLIRKTTF